MPRIVLISDTHDLQDRIPAVPDGDILVHAGDLTMLGRMSEIAAVGAWLRKQGEKFPAGVVVIAGNHDWMFEKNRTLAMSLMNQGVIGGGGKLMYLQDGGVEVMGLRIYGKRIGKAFREVISVDPKTATIEELEGVHSVGAKTARMYALYTRPDQQVIPLDTHILKWLRANG
jgi:hypothetical protein